MEGSEYSFADLQAIDLLEPRADGLSFLLHLALYPLDIFIQVAVSILPVVIDQISTVQT